MDVRVTSINGFDLNDVFHIDSIPVIMTQRKCRLPTLTKPAKEIFNDISTAQRCFQVADRMRTDRILTDITLIADGKKYPAHKFILATSSDYFLTLFHGPFARNDESLHLNGVPVDVFEDILKYMYTGIISISVENIQDILAASCLLLLMPLRNRCAKFLKDRLDVENCLGIYSAAKAYSLSDLIETSLEFIAVSLLDMTNLIEFKELCVDELIDVLGLENLSVSSEDYVLEAALTWLDYDVISRKEQFGGVLKRIHLPFVSNTLLQNVLESNLSISNDMMLSSIIKSAMSLSFSNFKEISIIPSAWLSPRKCIQSIPSVIAVAGPTLSILNSELDLWLPITKCKPRHCPGMDVYGSFIYIVGGSLEWKRKSSGEKFNTQTNEWSVIADMSTPRSNFGLVEHKGKLFALGGYDGDFPLKTTEAYDPKQDTWCSVSPMNYARDGACNLSDGEHLYVIGGYDGSKYLTSVEFYSDETENWDVNIIPPMAVKRQNAISSYYNGLIYIMGGYYADTYHSSLEVLDLETSTWSFLNPLPEPRHHGGAAAINGNIYVCGGWSAQVPVVHVDVYSIAEDQWKRIAPLPTPTMVRCSAVNFPRKSMMNLTAHANKAESDSFRRRRNSSSISSNRSLSESSS